MSDKDVDLDEEIKKLSRKTVIDIKKSEYAFENQIKKLDKDIDNIINEKLKDFDDNKQALGDYLAIDYSSSTIDRYREKLKRI